MINCCSSWLIYFMEFLPFFLYGHAGSDLYRWYSTTLLKYSLKPVLRIVIDNYETRRITQRTSRSSVCHFRITIGRLRASTTVRWPAIPICIFLGFPKSLRVNSGIVFNLGKDNFFSVPFQNYYLLNFITQRCMIAANDGYI